MFKLLFAIPNGIAGVIVKLILSPIVLLIVITLITGDFRKGYLGALLFHTVYSTLSICYSLLVNARPTKVVKFLFTSLRGVFFIVTTLIYWTIYLITYGPNFTF